MLGLLCVLCFQEQAIQTQHAHHFMAWLEFMTAKLLQQSHIQQRDMPSAHLCEIPEEVSFCARCRGSCSPQLLQATAQLPPHQHVHALAEGRSQGTHACRLKSPNHLELCTVASGQEDSIDHSLFVSRN